MGSQRAEVHNFVDAYHTYGDPNHGAFLRAAERELRLAIECEKEWYLPHANLGDVLSYQGYRSEGTRSSGDYQREALGSYDEALRLLADTPPEELLPSVRQRISLSRGIAQLLSGDADLRQEAMDTIREVQQDVHDLADRDARLVYVLACAYAVLARMVSEKMVAAEARTKATNLRDKVLAQDRSGDLRAWSAKDPDLAFIRDDSS